MSATQPEFLAHVADVCERAALGDLEARVLGLPEDGDLKRIGVAINGLLDVSDAYVRETAAAMDHCSRNLFHRPILERGMPGAYANASRVINRAAGKMKGDAEDLATFEAQRREMAAGVAEATAAVAAAVEEMNATSSEIKKQLGTAVDLTHGAVARSDSSVAALQQLTDAARRIESVVALIARIARHTNLLALNATIEAARAGEHGAGFAVVAGEVKALSQDTAKATEDISRTVEQMIGATGQVTEAIGAMGQTVKDVDTSASNILQSLDEQVRAAAEIATRITAVSNQTRTMTGH